MLEVTTEAKDIVQAILQQIEPDESDATMRLVAVRDETSDQIQIGLVQDQPKEGDQVVRHKGEPVLVIDQELSEQLEGIALGAVDTPTGPQLAMLSHTWGDNNYHSTS